MNVRNNSNLTTENRRKNTFPRRMSTGSTHNHDRLVPLCSCNSERLQEELTQLQRSSMEALQKSWAQVESLQQTSVDHDAQFAELEDIVFRRRERLETYSSRIEELESMLDAGKEVSSTGTISNTIASASMAGFRKIAWRASRHPSTSYRIQSFDDIGSIPDSGTRSLPAETDKEAEIRSLRLTVLSRNSTIESMERSLTQNVKMMQTCQRQIHNFQDLSKNKTEYG